MKTLPLLSLVFLTSACGPTVVWYGRSPDRCKQAKVIETKNKQYLSLDQKRGQYYDGIAIEGLVFSPDSKHLAYPARQDQRWAVVADGIRSPFWDGIGQVMFSPNSTELVYVAQRGSLWYVVRGADDGPGYEELLADSLRFSPDGKRLAFAIQRGKFVHVVIDGEAQPANDAIGKLSFSPDSGRLTYPARRGESTHLIVGDWISPPHEAIAEFAFNPQDERVAYLARQDQRWFEIGRASCRERV